MTKSQYNKEIYYSHYLHFILFFGIHLVILKIVTIGVKLTKKNIEGYNPKGIEKRIIEIVSVKR